MTKELKQQQQQIQALEETLGAIAADVRPILVERLQKANHKANLHHQRMTEFRVEAEQVQNLLNQLPDQQIEIGE